MQLSAHVETWSLKQPFRITGAEWHSTTSVVVELSDQAWDFETLRELLPACNELGLRMIEQPLRRGHDEVLESFWSPIPLAADESCQDTSELDLAVSRYDIINIKLDKPEA